MKDIQQLIKKNSQQGRYENIFPKTFLDAVIDKGSGVTLTDILSSFNMYFLSYNGSRESTRLQVPTSIRKQGLWITYVMYDGATIIEYYDTNLIDDTSWSNGNNWRVGNNVLVGDISISSEGNWIINGVDSKIPARGESGITPLLRVNDNKLEVSYTDGSTYVKVDDTPVFTQFRIYNNKLQQSTDLGKTWVNSSEYIAAWFRFINTTGESVGKIQISRDNGVTWTDLTSEFTNKLYIKGYRSSVATLPSSAVQGDIYGVGPTYDASDTNHTNPIYKLYVKDVSGWVDNGSFNSISAGVVQTTGDSETEVMSQKVVTTNIEDINNKFIKNTSLIFSALNNSKENILISDSLINIKKEGFSLELQNGKNIARIQIIGNNDISINMYSVGVTRIFLYLNLESIDLTASGITTLNWNDTDSIFISSNEYQLDNKNYILLSSSYLGTIQNNGLFSSFIYKYERSKLQIYPSDKLLIEKSSNDIYFKLSAYLRVRVLTTSDYDNSSLAASMGVVLHTSPSGLTDCLLLEDTMCWVFNLRTKKFSIISRTDIKDYMVVLIACVGGVPIYLYEGFIYKLVIQEVNISKPLSGLATLTSDIIPNFDFTNYVLTIGPYSILRNGYFVKIFNNVQTIPIYDTSLISKRCALFFSRTLNSFYYVSFTSAPKSTDDILIAMYDVGNKVVSCAFYYTVDGVSKIQDKSITFNKLGDDVKEKIENGGNSESIIDFNKDAISKIIQANRPINKSANDATKNEPRVFSMIHFSDIHSSEISLKRVIQFAERYTDHIDEVFHGGDTLVNYFENSADFWDKNVHNNIKPILNIIGNHERYANSNYTGYQPSIDIYNKIFAPHIQYWNVMLPQGNGINGTDTTYAANNGILYYYKDYDLTNTSNPTSKKYILRLICLDSTMEGNELLAQASWLTSVLEDARNNKYHVVIAIHHPTTITQIDCSFNNIDVNQQGYTVTNSLISIVKTHIDLGGEFICWLFGHTHTDYFGYSTIDSRQLCLTVTTAHEGYQSDYYADFKKIIGDKSQDSFNFVAIDLQSEFIKIIRIGADRDRRLRHRDILCYDYRNRIIVK